MPRGDEFKGGKPDETGPGCWRRHGNEERKQRVAETEKHSVILHRENEQPSKEVGAC